MGAKKGEGKRMKPCDQCPWRRSNHGRRSPGGFYTKKNLRRLWNELRRGGHPQSCHLTDPNHPDHVAAGAPKNAKPQECPGSVVLIVRELLRLAKGGTLVGKQHIDNYLLDRPQGLTRTGLAYWLIQRASPLAGTLLGGRPLPEIEAEDAAVGLPAHLGGDP